MDRFIQVKCILYMFQQNYTIEGSLDFVIFKVRRIRQAKNKPRHIKFRYWGGFQAANKFLSK